VEALRAANRGMARAVCQGAKTAKRYAALGAGMEVDAQGYGREPTAMVRGVLSCLFVCLFVPNVARKTQITMLCSFATAIGMGSTSTVILPPAPTTTTSTCPPSYTSQSTARTLRFIIADEG